MRNSTIRVALGAVQVVVRGVAVVVLVDGPVGQAELAEQAGLDQEPEGPVDRRPAHPAAGGVQVGDQLVGVEMLVRVEDMADQDPPRLGQLLAPDLEELAELLFGAFGTTASQGARGPTTVRPPRAMDTAPVAEPGQRHESIIDSYSSETTGGPLARVESHAQVRRRVPGGLRLRASRSRRSEVRSGSVRADGQGPTVGFAIGSASA